MRKLASALLITGAALGGTMAATTTANAAPVGQLDGVQVPWPNEECKPPLDVYIHKDGGTIETFNLDGRVVCAA